MSTVSSYDEYLSQLAARFWEEVRNSVAHKDVIDRFCLAIAPFGMAPSIYLSGDGDCSLTAIITCSDIESKILELTQAGFEVGDVGQVKGQFRKNTRWKASVSGHGLVFNLYWSSEDQ